jgi:methylenetetrahydrofolate reductase (NADPH)
MPESVIKRMEGSDNQIQEGADICAELIESFKGIEGVHGAHLMAPRNLSAIPETVKRSGITI